MKFGFPSVEISLKPQYALEPVVVVDGATVCVEFERTPLQHLMSANFLEWRIK